MTTVLSEHEDYQNVFLSLQTAQCFAHVVGRLTGASCSSLNVEVKLQLDIPPCEHCATEGILCVIITL